MHKRMFSTSAWLLLIVGFLHGDLLAQTPSVIPQPVTMRTGQGVFRITPTTPVAAADPARAQAKQLIDALAPATGFELKLIEGEPRDGAISLSLDEMLKANLGPEGYMLKVTPKRIALRAAKPAGLFYGIQTLRQLLPPNVFSPKRVEGVEWTVPCVTITDYPRFQWRGLLIDPARHFIPVKDFKHYVDAMALHKFNRLQVHFTDNIGWRIEIKKYPDLTRARFADGRDLRSGGEGRLRVLHAGRHPRTRALRGRAPRHSRPRNRNALPRRGGDQRLSEQLGINMGHARGGVSRPTSVGGKLGGLVAPRPETVAFMQDVLSEVIDLFPSPLHPHRRRRSQPPVVDRRSRTAGRNEASSAARTPTNCTAGSSNRWTPS